MTESLRTVADESKLERRLPAGFTGRAGTRPHVLAAPPRGRLAATPGGKR